LYSPGAVNRLDATPRRIIDLSIDGTAKRLDSTAKGSLFFQAIDQISDSFFCLLELGVHLWVEVRNLFAQHPDCDVFRGA